MTIYTATSLGSGEETNLADLPEPGPKGVFLEDYEPAARNQQRALLATVGLKAYADRAGDDGPENAISDLLADLRHLCDALDLDFGGLNHVAHNRYLEELRGE